MRLFTRGSLGISLIVALIIAGSLSGQTQLRSDDAQSIEGLPPEAPRTGTVITIDVSLNRLYLFRDGQLVKESPAATGSEKVLKQGSHVWLFRTPEGHLTVVRKIEDPVWTKPDWAFVEDGQRVPPLNSPRRKIKGHLGRYALDLGEGIMIHGTDESRSIGRKMSHGCIRLPNDMLKTVYRSAAIGTDVYIFESQVPQTATKRERHSDLDF